METFDKNLSLKMLPVSHKCNQDPIHKTSNGFEQEFLFAEQNHFSWQTRHLESKKNSKKRKGFVQINLNKAHKTWK